MGRLQSGYGTPVGVGELAHQLGGSRPHLRVGIRGQVCQCRRKNPIGARRASIILAPVAGESVERGDAHLGIGIVDHGDQQIHGFGVDQVVEQAAAAFAHSRFGMAQAVADRAECVLPAAQQFAVGRDGALRVTQARDQRVIVRADKTEHEFECEFAPVPQQLDFQRGEPEAPPRLSESQPFDVVVSQCCRGWDA